MMHVHMQPLSANLFDAAKWLYGLQTNMGGLRGGMINNDIVSFIISCKSKIKRHEPKLYQDCSSCLGFGFVAF